MMTRKLPVQKPRRGAGQRDIVPKDNSEKAKEKKPPPAAESTAGKFSSAHELSHMLTGDVSTFNGSVDRTCFAVLGRLALDYRAVITAGVPFVRARQSAATSGRLMSLILIRVATAGQHSLTIHNIADQLNMTHSTVSGWVDWLLKERLIRREGKHYWAAPYDFSLMRKALAVLKIGIAQSGSAIEALEKHLDREARNKSDGGG
jgi:DNA-binding MarR family transcriptional regulator